MTAPAPTQPTPETHLIPAPSDDRSDERGQGMVEYALILVLIAIVVIIALQVLGGTTAGLYTNIQNGISVATGH